MTLEQLIGIIDTIWVSLVCIFLILIIILEWRGEK